MNRCSSISAPARRYFPVPRQLIVLQPIVGHDNLQLVRAEQRFHRVAARYPLVLTDRTSTAQAGDEPVLIHQRTGAPVAVSPLHAVDDDNFPVPRQLIVLQPIVGHDNLQLVRAEQRQRLVAACRADA
jgi:hypothetical protein